MKFVPLSDHKTDGMPRRAVSLSILITQLLVSIDATTSKWTALVVKKHKGIPVVNLSIS